MAAMKTRQIPLVTPEHQTRFKALEVREYNTRPARKKNYLKPRLPRQRCTNTRHVDVKHIHAFEPPQNLMFRKDPATPSRHRSRQGDNNLTTYKYYERNRT